MENEADKIEIENIKKLIDRVTIELEVQRRTPTSINIFELCGIDHYETAHSAIIAGLLGWKGNRKSLECFIHHFSNIQLSAQELKSASVETEKCINVNGEQRRLDIVIRISNRLLIIIENKIFTSDHDQQLQAYSNWINNQDVDEKYLIYLTLYGSKSTEGCPDNEYKCLSYKNDIIHWLKECSSFTEFDMRYHIALFQYQEFWEKWFMETNELNEKIIPFIISNSASYNSTKQIATKCFWEARKHLISSTLQEWQNAKLKEHPELVIETKAEDMIGGKFESFFFQLNDCFDFGFEFISNFTDLYYGIKLKEPDGFDYKTEDFKGWEISSPWWPAFNYIKDNEVRYLGNNESLCIDSKNHIFSVLDAAFNEMTVLIKNESFTRCIGQVERFREELKTIDITPFTDIDKKDDGTYLKGAKLDGNTLGISFFLRPKGFKTIIWENESYNSQIIADIMNSQPKLKAEFPTFYKGDNRYWEHPEIIPFESIIDWLNRLLNLLKSMQ